MFSKAAIVESGLRFPFSVAHCQSANAWCYCRSSAKVRVFPGYGICTAECFITAVWMFQQFFEKTSKLLNLHLLSMIPAKILSSGQSMKSKRLLAALLLPVSRPGRRLVPLSLLNDFVAVDC